MVSFFLGSQDTYSGPEIKDPYKHHESGFGPDSINELQCVDPLLFWSEIWVRKTTGLVQILD